MREGVVNGGGGGRRRRTTGRGDFRAAPSRGAEEAVGGEPPLPRVARDAAAFTRPGNRIEKVNGRRENEKSGTD